MKKIVSFILVCCMVVAMLPVTVWAENYQTFTDAESISSINSWDGSIATSFAGGSGTESDPYQIANGAQLAYLAKTTNEGNTYANKYFIQIADIDLNRIEWEPIGNPNAPFDGNYDGNNYSISNLMATGRSYVGLFGLARGVKMCNLKLYDSQISGKDCVGGIIGGWDWPGSGNLENCHVINSEISGTSYVGGITGTTDNQCITISNCSVTNSKITGTADYVGGIVGSCWHTITSCTVDVNTTVNGKTNVGGIVGYLLADTTSGCANYATVIGESRVGGIVGYGYHRHLIKQCFNAGKIISTGDFAGGIAGYFYHNGSMEDCYNIGDVYAPNTTKAASILGGHDYGTIYLYRLYSYNCLLTTNQGSEIVTSELSFEGWDFENVWIMDTTIGRPLLRNNLEKYEEYTTAQYAGKQIKIKSIETGKYICGRNNAQIYADESFGCSIFEVTPMTEDGWVGIRLQGGNYISVTDDGDYLQTTSDNYEEWECFRIYEYRGYQYLLSHKNMKFVQATDEDGRPLKTVISEDSSLADATWERFQIEVLGDSQNLPSEPQYSAMTSNLQYLTPQEAEAFIAFMYNKTRSQLTQSEKEDNNLYDYLTGQIPRGTDEYELAQMKFLIKSAEAINMHMGDAEASIDTSVDNLTLFLESKINSDPSQELVDGCVNDVKSSCRTLLLDLIGDDGSIEMFESVFNGVINIVNIKDEAQKFVNELKALFDLANLVAANNNLNAYKYYIVYVNGRAAIDKWSTGYEQFDVYIANVKVSITEIDIIGGVFDKLGVGHSWTDEDTQHILNTFAEFTYHSQAEFDSYVSFEKESLTIADRKSYKNPATFNCIDGTDATIVYESSDSGIAIVSETGEITPVSVGTALITATASNGKNAVCSVEVLPIPTTGISLNKTSTTLNVGATESLIATVSPSNATNQAVTWTSSDTMVATVSSSGVVTAKTPGIATITVTTADSGEIATCIVEVKATAPAPFDLSGVAMTLGASLSLDFAVDTAKLTGTDNYAEFTIVYADGRPSETVTVPQSEWTKYSGTIYTAKFTGMAAKQMNDVVTAVFYNADGQPLTNEKSDSIETYAIRMLNGNAASNKKLRTVYVDMLNYGAAAQLQFNYDAINLANRNLTEAHQAWATASVETVNNRVSGTGYAGSTLTLAGEIQLDLVFNNSAVGTDYSSLYAIATYTDHYGNVKSIRVEGADFIKYSSTLCQVSITGMAVADFRSVVSCTVYNADDVALASASDSVESYANRNAASLGATVDTIVKFGASSYNYFH